MLHLSDGKCRGQRTPWREQSRANSAYFLDEPTGHAAELTHGGDEAQQRRLRAEAACVDAGAKIGRPKGKGGQGLGSLDKGCCPHERELNDSESYEHGIATFAR